MKKITNTLNFKIMDKNVVFKDEERNVCVLYKDNEAIIVKDDSVLYFNVTDRSDFKSFCDVFSKVLK